MSIYAIGTFEFPLRSRAAAPRAGLTAALSGAAQARLLLLEARPVVQVIFALRFGSAALLGVAAGGALTMRSVTAAAAWLLLTLVTYLANGAADVVEDQANGSVRPVASGRLSPRTAMKAARGGTVAALILAALSSPALAGLAVAMATLGWAYSTGPRPLKCTTGGTMLAVTGGGLLTYAAGWQAVGGALNPSLAGLALLMSAWMAVGGLSKDLSDVHGDQLAGRRTLLVRSGQRSLLRTLTVVALGVGGTGLVAAFTVSHLALTGLVVAAGGVTVARLGWTAGTAIAPGERRRPYRAFMLTQYAAHAFLCVMLALSYT